MSKSIKIEKEQAQVIWYAFKSQLPLEYSTHEFKGYDVTLKNRNEVLYICLESDHHEEIDVCGTGSCEFTLTDIK